VRARLATAEDRSQAGNAQSSLASHREGDHHQPGIVINILRDTRRWLYPKVPDNPQGWVPCQPASKVLRASCR
jgi:hypothetical protein